MLPYVKNWFIWKDLDAGKDGRQEEKEMTENEMVGWHHRLNGHEFEWTLGVGDGQGGLVCCRESDMAERLNWTEHAQYSFWFISVVFSNIWNYTMLLFYILHSNGFTVCYILLHVYEVILLFLPNHTFLFIFCSLDMLFQYYSFLK